MAKGYDIVVGLGVCVGFLSGNLHTVGEIGTWRCIRLARRLEATGRRARKNPYCCGAVGVLLGRASSIDERLDTHIP